MCEYPATNRVTPSVPSPPPRGARRWRLAACLLLAGTAAWHAYDLAVPGLRDRAGRLKAPDFLQFYTYGALAASGPPAALYDPSAHAAVARERIRPPITLTDFRPNYPPVVAWLVSPLASLPLLEAMAAFSLLSVACYASAVWLIAATGRSGALSGRVKALRDIDLALAAAAFPALFTVLRYGQLSALTLLLVAGAIAAAAARRDLLAGALLGLLVYKPNLLLLPALLFLVTRQWRLLAGLALGAGAELLADLALAGAAPMRQYLATLAGIARQPELVQYYPAESHSLRGFVRLLLPWPPLATAAGLAAVPLAAWLAARAWRAHGDWRPRWAALVLAALVASPHLLTYDLLLLAAPLLLLVDWHLAGLGQVPRGEWRWALLGLYFAAWPGTFVARLFQVQVSTVGMLAALWLIARGAITGADTPPAAPRRS
jgi:hypothetical protein